MKQNPQCYICVHCQQCDKIQEAKCKELNYILFTTEEQSQLCDLMGCYEEVEEDEN